MENDLPEGAMFGPKWWAFPLTARYASINAKESGLRVTIETSERLTYKDHVPCIVWRGSETQFRATKYFNKKPEIFPTRARWCCPVQLRGHLYPEGPDQYRYVIEWCHDDISPIFAHRHKKRAMEDQDYLRFREALLQPTPSEDMGSD